MNEAKIKACPFCGNDARVVETHRDHWHVECIKCQARVFPPHLAKLSAIGAWNERAGDRQPEAAPNAGNIAGSFQRLVKPHLVAEIEGSTEKELWQNLNWLLCNALDSKNEHGDWPRMVSETYRGKLEVRLNSVISDQVAKPKGANALDEAT